MSEKQKDNRKNRDKKNRTTYPSWIFGIIVLPIFFITIIGHFWLIPAKVGLEIEKTLLKFWDGQINIEDVEVNYFGPIYFGKVVFFDRAGRECLQTGRVKMVFEKWPGLHPVVTEIKIEKLNIQITTADGKFTLPFINPFQQSPTPRKKMDIRKLTINDAEITVTDAKGTKTLYENLQLQAYKKDNFYDFSLKRTGSEPMESLLAKGRLDLKTLETELSLQLKHTVKKPETALVFAALNIPNLSAEGNFEADLKISGCLKEPGGLEPNGIASIDGWIVAKNGKIIANNLTTKVNVSDGRYAFENLTANICDGNAAGSLYVETEQNQPTEFSGRLIAQDMSFIELTSILGGPGKKATKGTVTFNYTFSCKGKDLQNLIGEGQIFLDDADITVIPVVPHLFNIIGLSQLDPLKMSDAECSFSTTGPVVTVKTAHIANLFAAVRAEPGGTINLQTKQINIYVKAVMLKQIDAIVKNVPIINIINNLKDKLTRLKVQGNWSDPPSKLIKKEPINDIKEATVGFLQDIVNSGGQITQEMRKRFRAYPKPK